MSDFQFPVPADIDETPVVETAEQTPEVAEEAAPVEATPAATVEPTEAEKALAKKEAALKAWEKDLNRKASQLGAQEKAKPAPADDGVELDAESKKALNRYLSETLGIDPSTLSQMVTAQAATLREEVDTVTSEWFAAHPDIAPDDVALTLSELGVDVSNVTPKRAKTLLDRAAKILAADPIAPDIDAIVAAKVAEGVEKALAERVKDGETVVEVTRKGIPTDPARSLEDAALNLTPNEMFGTLYDKG